MPRLRLADGTVIEGATREEVMQKLASQSGQNSVTPVTPVTPQQDRPRPDAIVVARTSPDFSNVRGSDGRTQQGRADFQSRVQAEQDRVRAEFQREIDNLPWYEKARIGYGHSFADTGNAVRQLWNRATGDDEELAQLQAKEADEREIFDKITGGNQLFSVAGASNILGHISQAALPAGAVGKGAKAAAKAAALRGMIGKTVAHSAPYAAQMGLGAAEGALMPTVEGEDIKENMATGAVLSGLGQAAPAVGRGFARAGSFLPSWAAGPGFARAVQASEKRAAELIDSNRTAFREASGRVMGEAVEKTPGVPAMAARDVLNDIHLNYRNVLPKDFVSKTRFIRELPWYARITGKIKASELHREIRNLGTEAAGASKTQGYKRQGLLEARRKLEDLMMTQMSPMQKAKYLRGKALYADPFYIEGSRAANPAAIGAHKAFGKDTPEE